MRNYDRLRKAGLVPTYVIGMHRIDRRTLDAAIDKLSTFKTPEAALAAEHEPDDFWTKCRKARADRKAREADAMQRVEIVTKPRRGGGVTTTYYYRPTGQRLPYNRESLAFQVALERCEQDAAKAAPKDTPCGTS